MIINGCEYRIASQAGRFLPPAAISDTMSATSIA